MVVPRREREKEAQRERDRAQERGRDLGRERGGRGEVEEAGKGLIEARLGLGREVQSLIKREGRSKREKEKCGVKVACS